MARTSRSVFMLRITEVGKVDEAVFKRINSVEQVASLVVI